MAYKKITDEDLNNIGVCGLPDTPQLSTAEMQEKFEETSKKVIIPAINSLIDELSKRDENVYTKEQTENVIAEEIAKSSGMDSSYFAQKPVIVSVDVPAANWTGEGPYIQEISVSGVLFTDEPLADVLLSDIYENALAQQEAWNCISRIDTSDDKVTLTCYEEKPQVNITVRLNIVR